MTNARLPGSRCYGYILLATKEDATKCIQHLHRTEYRGKTILVSFDKVNFFIYKMSQLFVG